MNQHLRDRILRKLDALSDERGYQVLDYVEFLESKFAERQTPPGNAFTRFSEAVEDRLRAGKVSAAAIAETMGLLNRAANILNGAVAAGKSVATDIYSAAQATGTRPASGGSGPAAGSPASASGSTAPPAESNAASPASTTDSMASNAAIPSAPVPMAPDTADQVNAGGPVGEGR